MGATYYSMQWAEEQLQRWERNEKLSAFDMKALLLVLREENKRLREALRDVSHAMSNAAEGVMEKTENSVVIAYRNSTWRLRGGGPFDDDETDI